ncbi:11793_t:CDS:2 [Ambispora gerdemannii]|uniref:11793_t:CDS:1 n=1 Tax=Ambispora gerdemannii TaxID=144530 RepID=A0A9N9CAF8_9GLOM|nr:11793_t:CDS:2 [Ambispora gerdemannii]
MSTPDPISLLHDYYRNKEEVFHLDYDKDHISSDYKDLSQAVYLQFGTHVLDKETPTTFESSDEPYSLGVLYHAMKTKDLNYNEYHTDAIENAKFQVPMNFMDRKKWLKELENLASAPPYFPPPVTTTTAALNEVESSDDDPLNDKYSYDDQASPMDESESFDLSRNNQNNDHIIKENETPINSNSNNFDLTDYNDFSQADDPIAIEQNDVDALSFKILNPSKYPGSPLEYEAEDHLPTLSPVEIPQTEELNTETLLDNSSLNHVDSTKANNHINNTSESPRMGKSRTNSKFSVRGHSSTQDDNRRQGKKRDSSNAFMHSESELARVAYLAKRHRCSADEYIPDKQWLDDNMTKHERPIIEHDHISLTKKNSLSKYLELAHDLINKPRPLQPNQIRVSHTHYRSSTTKPSSSTSRNNEKEPKKPIIMVSPSPRAMVGIYNAKDFFQDSSFIENEQKRSLHTASKPTLVEFTYKERKYEIADLADTLRPEDWDRVVGVVVDGNDWQFKHWKWQSTEEIFKKVRAFHFKYSHQPTIDNVLRWGKSVQVINISRDFRHKDAEAHQAFWDALETHIYLNLT